MKKLLWTSLLVVLFCLDISAQTLVKVQGYAERGGKSITTSPTVTYKVQESYPSATVTVYVTGTTTLVSIYSDASSTPKSNPFTAASDGSFFFYIGSGRYDIKFSGTGIVTPFTISDVFVGSTLSQNQLDALAGSYGTPSASNPFVTRTDPILSGGSVVYNVKAYNVKGDGIAASGGAITSGTSNLSVSGATFTSGVVGKTVVIPGAGIAGVDLVTTALSFVDATHITTALPASTSVSGKDVIYGTDDTASFQAVLDTACAAASGSTSSAPSQNRGVDVNIPSGMYLVTSLSLSSSGIGNNGLYNLRIYGTGGATRIATISPTADVLTLKGDGAPTVTTYNSSIKDLFFWPAVTRTAGWEMVIQRAYQITITDIRFQLNWGCIQIGNVGAIGATEGVFLERIKAFAFKYGLKTYQVISLWHRAATWSSYRLDATTIWLDSYTEGCTFEAMDISNPLYTSPGNTGIALLISHSNGALSPPRYLRFIGIFFDSHSVALYAQAGQDVTFTGCFFHATTNGIWIVGAGCDGFTFVNCTARGCGSNGVLFEAGTRLEFLSSKSVGNNTNSTGGSGLVIIPAATNVRVADSTFTNSWGTGGSQNIGIWIQAGANNFIITGNNTLGNAANNLLNDAGTSATKIVANNIQ